MATKDYTLTRATASRLIEKFGGAASLVTKTASGSAFDPTFTETLQSVQAVIVDYTARERAGTSIQEGDRRALVTAPSGVTAPGIGEVLRLPSPGEVRASLSNTGNGVLTFSSTPALSGAQGGEYVVTFTDADTFSVTDATGNALGSADLGENFTNQIAFSISAGNVAFVAGDKFFVGVFVDYQIAQFDVIQPAGPSGVLVMFDLRVRV